MTPLTIYIALLLLIQGCGTVSLDKKKDGVGRSASAAANGSYCVKWVNTILKAPRESLLTKFNKKLIAPMVKKLSKFSTKQKFQFLKLLKSKSGRFKFQTEMYAKTLNQMLNKNILSLEDIPELIKQTSKSKYILDFSYQEVRVLERSMNEFPSLNQTMDTFLQRKNMTISKALKMRNLLSEADLDLKDLKEFMQGLTSIPKNSSEWGDLKNYLSFAGTMKNKAKAKTLNDVDMLFSSGLKSKNIKKFYKLKLNISKYNYKQYHKQYKKFLNKNVPLTEAKRLAKIEADKLTEVYSHLKYACRSAKPTGTTKRAAKATSGFFMATGLAATTGTYAYANWDKDKEEAQWYGKLGHDLIWKMIFQFGYNAIMTDPAASLLKKTISLHVFYTPADAIEAGMYDLEFGEDNSFIDEEYERLKKELIANDPSFAKKYNDLVSYLGKDYLAEQLKDFFKAVVSGEVELPQNEVDEILSAEDLTLENMEDEELKEKLLEAISIKLYDQNSGKVKLGSHFLDRYAFVRSYDVMDVPRSLLVGLWIYRTMCMGGNNMRLALIKASTIYVLDQVIGKYIYYQVRRDLINM
jgi:hypothetical protein